MPFLVTDAKSRLRLVFGASGYIGANLVPFLRERGVPLRATSRNVEVPEGRGWAAGVELVSADALDEPTLERAPGSVDTAYYLVHSMAAGAASRTSTAALQETSHPPPPVPASAASSTRAGRYRTIPNRSS